MAQDTRALDQAPRAFPFSTVLAVSIGLLVLLAVTAVLGIQLWASHRNTSQLLNEKAARTVERIETEVQRHLEPAVGHAAFVAGRIEAGAFGFDDKDRLADFILGSMAGVPSIWGMAVWDTDLNEVGARRNEKGELVQLREDRSDDARLRGFADQIAATEEGSWGEIIFGRFGNTLINYRRPLRRDGRYIGFLLEAISVPELSEYLTDIGDIFGGTAFILYGRERVIAHPNLTSVHPEQSRENPLVALGSVGDLVLEGLWQGEPIRGFERAAEDKVEVVRITVGGDDYVSMYKWVEDYGQTPWAIGAWFPVEELNEEVLRLWRSGAAGLVTLVLAILAAILLGRLIARPIGRLAASAVKVGELNLSRVEHLEASRIKELDDQASAFNKMLTGLRSFETYVPRSLVTRLIRRGGHESVRSEERELTVMFTDVVGFTAMSEQKQASDIAEFLNEHFRLLGSCVEAEGGTIDKFIGDALMAFWGAPDRQSDTAARACRAALAIAREIAREDRERETAGRTTVRVRIGIHTGPVVVGNVGWPGRMNYTIVGDPVNTCQRIEALGKQIGGVDPVTILISEATAAQLDADFRLEHAGSFEVRGKTEPVDVYRLIP